MKTLGIEQVTLDACVREAQQERVLVTRDGRPVAMVVGLAGLDEDQLQLRASDKFWQLITARRKQRTVTRAELERLASGVADGMQLVVEAAFQGHTLIGIQGSVYEHGQHQRTVRPGSGRHSP